MKKLLMNERGSMKDFVAVIGLAIVTAVIIGGAMIYAPDTAEQLWEDAVDFVKDKIGL